MNGDGASKVRVGALLLGAGAGGFVTATALHQLWRWQELTGGSRGTATWDPWVLGVVGAVTRLALWVAVIVGIGLLWAASEQGRRSLPARAVVVRAVSGWGVAVAVMGLAGSAVDRDRALAVDVAVIVGGLVVAGFAWRAQRDESFEPGPRSERPRAGGRSEHA